MVLITGLVGLKWRGGWRFTVFTRVERAMDAMTEVAVCLRFVSGWAVG